MNLDIIGDIHGEFGKLESLLKLLGYRERNGAYRHADRTAVFVGDLIDRGPQQLATVDLVRRMVDAGSEALCKGLEVPLLGGVSFKDAEGTDRTKTRIKWWADGSSTFRQAALAASRESIEKIPDLPMPPHSRVEPYNGPPVFVGHYWLEFDGATPQLLAPNIACVDYSAAKDGPLVAYQWDGESELSANKFRWFPGELD